MGEGEGRYGFGGVGERSWYTEAHATRPDGSQQMFVEVGSTDKTLKLYDGHFHDLLNDLGRDQVIADIARWIEERLAVSDRKIAPMPPISV